MLCLFICHPLFRQLCLDNAGGSRGPDFPPELPSGVHAKRKNPVTIFFVEGVGG